MATTHHGPGEVIDLRPTGPARDKVQTEVLAATGGLKLMRLVLPAGKELPTHTAPGMLVVQCLEGQAEFTALGKTVRLGPGELVYLPAGEPHAVRAVEASSLLVTVFRESV